MRRLGDEGFTLVELLVSIVVLGILIGAITEAIFVGLRTTNGTNQRLVESHDAQMVASLFVTDVQSADKVMYQPLAADPSCPVAPIPLLTFTGTDPVAGPEVVSYIVQSQQLVRHACAGGTVTNVVAAHLLSTTSPLVSCSPSPCTASGTPVPRTVSISLQAVGNDGTAYSYALQGSRRQT